MLSPSTSCLALRPKMDKAARLQVFTRVLASSKVMCSATFHRPQDFEAQSVFCSKLFGTSGKLLTVSQPLAGVSFTESTSPRSHPCFRLS